MSMAWIQRILAGVLVAGSAALACPATAPAQARLTEEEAALPGMAKARPPLRESDSLVGASFDDILRSPLGALLRRPWLDAAALRLLTSAVLPSSRLLASAEAAGFDAERFVAANPRLDSRLARWWLSATLTDLAAQHGRMRDTEAKAIELVDPATPAAALAAAEVARIAASQPYVLGRLRFVELAPFVDAVAYAIPPEEALVARFGAFEGDPAAAYTPPATTPQVIASRPFRSGRATVRLLRFAPPMHDVPGPVLARVIEPEGVADPPSYVHCHGIGIDAQQYDSIVDDIASLVTAGIRVVRLVLPWHGRRRVLGTWSGEPVLATARLGPLALCAAAAQEILAAAWRIPSANVFVRRLGHSTLPLALAGDGGPLARFATILHNHA